MRMMACEGSQDTCARALFERDMIMYKEARESCSHFSQVMRMMMIVIMAIRIRTRTRTKRMIIIMTTTPPGKGSSFCDMCMNVRRFHTCRTAIKGFVAEVESGLEEIMHDYGQGLSVETAVERIQARVGGEGMQ